MFYFFPTNLYFYIVITKEISKINFFFHFP